MFIWFFFFFQAEAGIRDFHVTGVQTCALPISSPRFSVRSLPSGLVLTRREGAGGQPPRTTQSRIPLFALYAATRWWFSASRKLRRRYGSAEAAPPPPPTSPPGQRRDETQQARQSEAAVGQGPVDVDKRAGLGAASRDPISSALILEGENPNLVAP